jgi:WD40 repeat protein
VEHRNYETMLPIKGNMVVAFALHPTRSLMAVSDLDGVHLVDLVTGKTTDTLELHFPSPRYAAFSPDGAVLAVTYLDNRIRLWDTSSGQLLSTFYPDPNHAVDHLAFSPDGNVLAVPAIVRPKC